MIHAGVDVLLRTGVDLGAGTVRYADAFALLAEEHDQKVTRGSVHGRIWSSQEAWQIDVVCEAVRRVGSDSHAAVASALSEALVVLPTDTPEQRMNVVAEACRVGALEFIRFVEETPGASLLAAVLAARQASVGRLPEHERLTEQLQQIERDNAEQTITAFTALADVLGLQPHPRRGMERAEAIRALCVTSATLGMSHTIRLPHDPALSEPIAAIGPDGEQRPWNLLGLGLWLVARGLLVAETPDSAQPSEDTPT